VITPPETIDDGGRRIRQAASFLVIASEIQA